MRDDKNVVVSTVDFFLGGGGGGPLEKIFNCFF